MRIAAKTTLDKTCQAGDNSISDKTAEQIDSAIKSIADNIYDQTLALLEKIEIWLNIVVGSY